MSRPTLRVAIVAYQGVLADESCVFRDVLSKVPGSRTLTVGADVGITAGPGGAQQIVARFDDVRSADVVVVPGGLGSHRHPEISAWIRRIHPRWIVASSTGSALLAVGGLLEGRTAATHWLAGPLLERCGVEVSPERVVVDPPFITCTGLASTFDAALLLAGSIGGPGLVRDIRAQLADDARASASAEAPARATCAPATARASTAPASSSRSSSRSTGRDG